jgi:hypothetical protein
VDSVDDLRVIDATQIHRGYGQISVPELALDDKQRDTLTRHLHRVRVAELMWREASPDSGASSRSVKLGADASGRPWPPAGRAAQNAEQCADRKTGAQRRPRDELLPGPAVHPHLTALAALAISYEDRASPRVEVTLSKRECLADSEAGAPEYDDQAAQSGALRVVACHRHDGDDFLDSGWVCGIAQTFIVRRTARVESREGCR